MRNKKSKSKLKTQTRRAEKWTAQTWSEIALMLANTSADRSLSKKQRNLLAFLAETAYDAAARLSGYTPEEEAEYYRQCQAEDEAMVARRTPEQVAAFATEEAARDAEYKATRRCRGYAPVSRGTSKRKNRAMRPSQLEMALA
jgi:hypothetical protein